MEAVSDTPQTEAITRLAAAVDTVLEAGMVPGDEAEARRLLVDLEAQARRVRAAQVELIDEIDRAGLHAADGHASAKVMARHVCRLSGPEANRRHRAAKCRRNLPEVWAAFRSGRIGGCHLDRISAVLANDRVHDAVVANEASFATQAETTSYRTFDAMVGDWVRVMDQDGTRDRNQRSHENRNAKFHQDFDGSWNLTGGCGSLWGVELNSILNAFVEAEFAADWVERVAALHQPPPCAPRLRLGEQRPCACPLLPPPSSAAGRSGPRARAEHGDQATTAHLGRTDAQRRFDALFAIFQKAAAAHATGGGSKIVTNLVIDQDTFERITALLTGGTAETPDPTFAAFPLASYRCTDLDGHPVEATEAVTAALVGHIRRVVTSAEGVVIDMGRQRRLFTGPAALAVKLASTTCYWPGCHVPVTDCQSDHLRPWSTRADGSGGGSTNPGNGGPGCGRHNRLKEHGYTVHRDPSGTWHTHRPDGTEIQ